MARKVRTHLTTDTAADTSLTPKHLTKQEFGKRLHKMMLARGWHQSELARRADLPRDSISVYVRGRSLPTPTSLKSLAGALGVSAEELLPNQMEGAIDEDTPSLEIRVSTNSSDVAWIRLNRAVSVRTALKIAELLENDNVLKKESTT